MMHALIFDCDGTLVDSMPLHWQAWQHMARRHGFSLSEERFYQLGGIPSRDILAIINQEQGLSLDTERLSHEKEQLYLERLPRIRPIEPVVQIARAHQGRGPMAVASGGRKEIIHAVLRHTGIHDLFEAIVTSEDVVRQKPAPDIFLEAARQIHADPAHCRAYEDTDLGMAAIRAAGMEAVDVRILLTQS